jgi:nucleoside-diphosphate-sugar epimerase
MNSPKIIITGGSGFIGTSAVMYGIQKGYRVVNYDINPPKSSKFEEYWREIDLIDLDSLSRAVQEFQPTHILHLAADLGMDHINFDNLQCNIKGIDNLIESVKLVNSVQRIIFVSSLLVCKNGYIPNNDTDYCPPNYYGKSKVIGEEKVRSADLDCEWAIVRPTSIWGPLFDYSYKDFFKTIDKNRYFHIGNNEFQKPASFVGNTVYMMMKILLESNPNTNNETFYLADYPWYSTRKWAITIQTILNTKRIRTAPIWMLRIIAKFGDIYKVIIKIDPPLTSFRLNNMLTGGAYPLENTKKICGDLPFDLNESVYRTAAWMYENNLIKHKPGRI